MEHISFGSINIKPLDIDVCELWVGDDIELEWVFESMHGDRDKLWNKMMRKFSASCAEEKKDAEVAEQQLKKWDEDCYKFKKTHKGKRILFIETVEYVPHIADKRRKKYFFLEGECGFDVLDMYKKLPGIIKYEKERKQKIENSNDPGERQVEYALKWFMAAHEDEVIAVDKNCESKYRYNCILLCKPDFIDEPQEYDHILVTPSGIIIIETKHWQGAVKINSAGKWMRRKNEIEQFVGIESPKFQMRRHQLLINKILPNIPVYSILCFSNGKIILEGTEFFTDYPLTTVENLEETLSEIQNNNKFSIEDMKQIVNAIDNHKVNLMKS